MLYTLIFQYKKNEIPIFWNKYFIIQHYNITITVNINRLAAYHNHDRIVKKIGPTLILIQKC